MPYHVERSRELMTNGSHFFFPSDNSFVLNLQVGYLLKTDQTSLLFFLNDSG